MAATIHPTAIIAPTAVIGDGTVIGPYAIVEDDVVIGKDNIIESHVVLKRYLTIGDGNHIHSHAVIGDLPQDTSFDKKKVSRTLVGNGNEFREFVNIHRSKNENGVTIVGNNNYFMENVHIAHDCIVHDRVVSANNLSCGGHVEIFSDVFISACVGVHQFCRIGAYCMLGFGAKVALDIPPYSLADHNPAKVFKLNLVGLRRKGFKSDDIKAVEAIHDAWYHTTMSKKDFIEFHEKSGTLSEHQKIFVEFLKASQRGIAGHV
ncbi:MAG: acyl-ACP--UDP-N-acetylglucosamine O-acyltransferase [Spirochaetes bacterium]|nr:acyl-ACP--UDP-N-acetylglucosamine O-acyltransferase [Spirochaetota bacterium]